MKKKLTKKQVVRLVLIETSLILFLTVYVIAFWGQVFPAKITDKEIITTNSTIDAINDSAEDILEQEEGVNENSDDEDLEDKSDPEGDENTADKQTTVTPPSGETVTDITQNYSPKRILYVTKVGKDSNAGTKSSPFLTINQAIQNARAGDEIRIGSGTYKETLDIDGLKGTESAPIYIVGSSSSLSSYPIVDGGDSAFTDSKDDPIFYLEDCAWLSFERLKFVGGSESVFQIHDSSYISFRRNSFHINRYGVKLKDKSNHILLEYNEFYQTFGNSTWSDLKGTKWEGGAFVSYGGAGMNEIRYNNFHDLMNGVVLYRSSRIGNYYDANVWVHHNRFENIVDDPFEPESYSFNTHFYSNTLVNTHRMASFALDGSTKMLGPVYVYGNYQLITKDPTGESVSDDRVNSALKIDLVSSYYTNGIYVFNNSIDIQQAGANTYGVDILDKTINRATILNNIFRINNTVYSSSNLVLNSSNLNNNFSKQNFNYTEANGYTDVDPLFVNRLNEDGRLQSSSTARNKSIKISGLIGFNASTIISSSSDLGAYTYGTTSYRYFPSPKYVTPPGGESTGFAANRPWAPDYLSGYVPRYKADWMY